MNEIKLEYDTHVSVVHYESLDSRSFNSFSKPKWSKLVNKLSVPIEANYKYARGVAVYGDIKDGANDHGEIIKKHRNDVNVVYRDVIVLDYDEINDLKQLHEAISSALSNVAWFWHTSYSHRTEQARIRLYIPLNERISADDYRKYSKVLANKIGHKVDEGSYQPSRCFALPVIQKGHIFIKRVNDCPIIGVDMLEQWSKELEQSNASPNVIGYTRRDSAYWRELSFGTTEGNRNNALASLVGHLLRCRVNDYIVYSYALLWGQFACKPPMKEQEINATFQSILNKHYNN